MAERPDQPQNGDGKEPTPIKIKSAGKKSDTTRIDLSAAKPPTSFVDKNKLPADAQDHFKSTTMRIDLSAGKSESKSDTAPMDTDASGTPPSYLDKSKLPADAQDHFKSTTMRFSMPEAEEAGKSDTAPMDTGASGAPSSYLDKNKLPPDAQEYFNSSTMRIDAPSAGSNMSETVAMDLSSADVEPSGIKTPERPKSLRIGKIAPKGGDAGAAEKPSPASPSKSETARIDFSDDEQDRPVTRPKTIRIKRPDGTTPRKTLAVARPDADEDGSLLVSPAIAEEGLSEDEPGLLVGITAIAALLVAGGLFYVLLAQTLVTNLPFPGKI